MFDSFKKWWKHFWHELPAPTTVAVDAQTDWKWIFRGKGCE